MIVRFGLVDGAADSWPDIFESTTENVRTSQLNQSVDSLEQIPEGLTQRLQPAGILIAPVGPHHGTQTLVRVTRTAAGFERRELVDVRFVPALLGIAREL